MKVKGKGHCILVAYEDKKVASFILNSLTQEGVFLSFAKNREETVQQVRGINPSLILLDSQLSDTDAMETCHFLRNDLQLKKPLIAIITPENDEFAKISGYESGADFCFSMPKKSRLLACKVKAMLNRLCAKNKEFNPTQSIIIDRERYLVLKDKEEIQFSRMEFEILELLANKPGRVFTREQIMAMIWGNKSIVGMRTIDVHIRKLREKLGDSYIRTVKGVGYTFNRK
ncbi:MAG: response regulator transcription factor [Flavobacteriales bacterium]|jgi:two-component system alkaline phosphatase synthesis response regulator PhoP